MAHVLYLVIQVSFPRILDVYQIAKAAFGSEDLQSKPRKTPNPNPLSRSLWSFFSPFRSVFSPFGSLSSALARSSP